mgnify:CR=1 FL=1
MAGVTIDEVELSPQRELSKSQTIRLVDVFFIAPFLFYVGAKAKGITPMERYIVYTIAVTTLIYNGRNYLINRKR